MIVTRALPFTTRRARTKTAIAFRDGGLRVLRVRQEGKLTTIRDNERGKATFIATYVNPIAVEGSFETIERPDERAGRTVGISVCTLWVDAESRRARASFERLAKTMGVKVSQVVSKGEYATDKGLLLYSLTGPQEATSNFIRMAKWVKEARAYRPQVSSGTGKFSPVDSSVRSKRRSIFRARGELAAGKGMKKRPSKVGQRV